MRNGSPLGKGGQPVSHASSGDDTGDFNADKSMLAHP